MRGVMLIKQSVLRKISVGSGESQEANPTISDLVAKFF